MSRRFHHVPLDDPYLDRFGEAHAIDQDPPSTTMAIGIVKDAVAAGHPADGTAAERTLTGASAATAVQATMKPFHDEAVIYDQAAEEHSTDAVHAAQDAKEAAARRRDLPGEAVQLSDGSSRTRAQVHAGHEDRLAAAAQRETRGDFEHYARPPSLPVRLLVVVVLASIEVFLLIWPVTDASWAAPQSVAYVAGLVVLFLLMNEELPRLAGLAIRDAREAMHAAWELTQVGLTGSRGGDPAAGRETTGHVDERFVRAAEHKKWTGCGVLSAVAAIYSAVMFTRVDRLAAGLGWPTGFVLLASGLITAVTAGGLVILTWWWSRGNALGDQLREYGTLTDLSRALAEDLAAESRAYVGDCADATGLAHRQLDLAEQELHHGYHTIGVGLQKAAKILDQQAVLTPRPTNLFAVGRPVRDRATANLCRAKDLVTEAEQILARTSPFAPVGPHPNPWAARCASRQARANPAFVDPYQLGLLHIPEPSPARWWQRPWVAGPAGAVLLALAAIVTVVLLIHG
jgi:hypothetical protein